MSTDSQAAHSCWEEGARALADDDWPAALHAFREAVRIDPQFGEAYDGMGAALYGLGDWAASAEAHRRALVLLPDDRYAAYNLALALLPLGSAAEAEQHLRRLLDQEPQNDDIAFNLGLSLAEQSKCNEALDVFTRIAHRTPTYPFAHLMAARELAHFGRDDEARRFLRQELDRDGAACDGWDDAEQLRKRLGV